MWFIPVQLLTDFGDAGSLLTKIGKDFGNLGRALFPPKHKTKPTTPSKPSAPQPSTRSDGGASSPPLPDLGDD